MTSFVIVPVCYSIQNFVKIGLYFSEIWRYDDFQDGGRPPFWIFKAWNF